MPTASGTRSARAGALDPRGTHHAFHGTASPRLPALRSARRAALRVDAGFTWMLPLCCGPHRSSGAGRIYGRNRAPDAVYNCELFAVPGNGAEIQSARRRARGPGVLGAHAMPSARRSSPGKPKYYCLSMFPYPSGQAPHGARAQLYDRRRAHPLPPHEGLQRAAADGLGRVRPARRERRDGERRAAGAVDLRQHRVHEAAAEVARLRDRLVARAGDLQAGVLPLEPVAVPAHAREGPRLQENRRGELGPGRPDGARQRAGDRRPRLAHGRGRGEARDPDVLHGDHALRRGAARRPRATARLARAREDDAGQLDRQEPRRALCLSLRARTASRRSSGSSPRAPTRSWASPSSRWPPSIRLPRAPRGTIRSSPLSSRNASAAA